MIVDDLDIGRAAIRPNKTEPELVVQTNGMLALSVSVQGLEPVAGRKSKIVETSSVIQHQQFAFRDPDQVGRKPLAGHPTLQDALREAVLESYDRQRHAFSALVSRNDTLAKRPA